MSVRILYLLVLGLVLASGAWVAASDRLEDGRKAYEAGCAGCHRDGNEGAPVTGEPADWADRSGLWDSVLVEHARKGYINMPPRGGDEGASDYDVEAAVEYMLTITHPEMPAD